MKISITTVISDMVLIAVTVLIYFLEESNLFSKQVIFIMLNVNLFIYIFRNLKDQIKRNSKYKIFTFTGVFIISQFLVQVLFGNFSLLFGESYFSAGWEYLNKSMYIAIIGCFGIMLGYRCKKAEEIGQKIKNKIFMSAKYKTDYFACFIAFIISSLAYYILIKMGLVGFSDEASIGAQAKYAAIQQYIIYIASINEIVLFLLYIDLLKTKRSMSKFIFPIFFVFQLYLGILSASKTAVLALILSLLIINLIYKGKISKILVAILMTSVIGLYQYIDIFRSMLRGAYIGSRYDLLVYAIHNSSVDSTTILSAFQKFLSRINIIESCSAVVRYKDTFGIQFGDPKFLEDLILSPVYAIIPRFILPSKSTATYGVWVSRNVYGSFDSNAQSYVTVQGFFYLAGGIACVFIGFYLMGLFLNVCSGIINVKAKEPILVATFLMICFSVLYEASTPREIFIQTARGIIIYILAGRVLVKKVKITKNITGKHEDE